MPLVAFGKVGCYNCPMKFKNDKYRKARGGFSRFLEIKCGSCESFICYYQKDGPGIIKRLYQDRILGLDVEDVKQIICKNCKSIIGTRTIYEKENRLAYSVPLGSISRKIIKASLL